MLVKVSKYLQELVKSSTSIKREFYPSGKERKSSKRAFIDPLLEDEFTPTKGLCHKYPHRILVQLTMDCASFCRFCTRRRKVSDIKNGKITKQDIKKMIEYVKSKPQINEIIFSGGDPLMVPDLLIYALKEFSNLFQIKILRLHTRIPVSNPGFLKKEILDAFSKIKKQPLYLSIHFEHPDELTPETIRAVRALRKTGAILISQSVFLKGINDSYKILETLFSRLIELGIKPYYIYHCDLVEGIEHFIVPLEKEVEIMTRLRKNLSGLATPLHIIDTPNGSGKVPVPLNFWKFDKSYFIDFKGKKIKTY